MIDAAGAVANLHMFTTPRLAHPSPYIPVPPHRIALPCSTPRVNPVPPHHTDPIHPIYQMDTFIVTNMRVCVQAEVRSARRRCRGGGALSSFQAGCCGCLWGWSLGRNTTRSWGGLRQARGGSGRGGATDWGPGGPVRVEEARCRRGSVERGEEGDPMRCVRDRGVQRGAGSTSRHGTTGMGAPLISNRLFYSVCVA